MIDHSAFERKTNKQTLNHFRKRESMLTLWTRVSVSIRYIRSLCIFCTSLTPSASFSISEFGDDQITTTPSYDCHEKDDGLYPDPEDCHNFFECSNGRSLFFRCPDGLAFDDAAHACNFENLVPACSSWKAQTCRDDGIIGSDGDVEGDKIETIVMEPVIKKCV